MKQRVAPGAPATMAPGETRRKRRAKIEGKTASKQDRHATNPRARQQVLRGEKWLKRQR